MRPPPTHSFSSLNYSWAKGPRCSYLGSLSRPSAAPLRSSLYTAFPDIADAPLLALTATAACAAAAAVASSLLSQPGDALLSAANGGQRTGQTGPPGRGRGSIAATAAALGPAGLMRGTQVRVCGKELMCGTQVRCQRRSHCFWAARSARSSPACASPPLPPPVACAVRTPVCGGLFRLLALACGAEQARLVQMVAIVVTQLLVYDSVKAFVGLPVTGSV